MTRPAGNGRSEDPERLTPPAFNTDLLSPDRVRVRVLDELPIHDTTWDLRMHSDDTLYIGARMERTGGGTAWLCSYRACRVSAFLRQKGA